ncbi:trigger factor [Acetobacter orleanensis]|uniref:Trigger factor n=1 Tax=Acetobacter orleanensis TaxID=104099 RepID=A0A4Y3TPU1_9PROT|nr:trigger factor [Acetobacter orleanensis]KXV65569.1 trigger factor [Acetobacter orleanensis]PCD79106.1 trigger factor [Acetobacter orleanensis]GAN67703.1 peptidyl-prolyl cis-trans isomerase trigger factor [Acetobacter orleanensis JCM 7639]GBR22236.1 peptidyl-prolyl cis-trans isomerase trigger factor [Acetobacter orleanensis NRIC 0473]GEB83040.1 trigger factor [Acetobacter orleanensis]
MQVTDTLTEGLKRGFTITIPAAELAEKRDARLKEVAANLTLPGFRPGKVPVSVARQRHGDAVRAEVLEQAVSDALRAVLEERGLRPAGQPQVELVSGQDDDGKDLEFKVETEILPEITVPDLSDLSLTRLKAVASDEAVDKILADVAKRQRTFETVEDVRPAVMGDVVSVDFVGKRDGVPFDGGTAQDVNVEIGGEGFIPGFAEQIEGMKPGEEKIITVTFPENYGAEELAGKEATFDITVKELKKPVDAPIDDELAKLLGFETLDQLRDLVRKQIEGEYDQLSRLRIKRELLDALATKTDFQAPQGMVDAEFEQIWQRVEADRKAGQLDDEDKDKDEDTLRADYRKIAERRVKLGLLLAEIGRKNAITVTQDELGRAMRAEAMRYQGQEKEVFTFFQNNPQAVESLRGPIFENKVVDYLIELAKVEDKEVTPEELSDIPPADI